MPSSWLRQAALQQVLDRALSQKELDVNHLQAAIWARGQLVFTGVANRLATGPVVTQESLFRLASVSKPVSALGALVLVEQKRLELDAPLLTYLPELPPTLQPLTCRQLLTHTSGLRHYGAKGRADAATGQVRSAREALKVFLTDPLFATPGQKYHYSTHAFTLLGAVVEALTQQPFVETQQALLRRMGLKDIGFESLPGPPDPQRSRRRAPLYDDKNAEQQTRENLSWKWPGGGMESTASDLVTFFGRVMEGKGIPMRAWELLQQRQAPPKEPAKDDPVMGLGIPLQNGALVHSGSQQGASSYVRIVPATRTVTAVLCNTEGRRVSALCRQLEQLVRT